jgi:hypothetical protein
MHARPKIARRSVFPGRYLPAGVPTSRLTRALAVLLMAVPLPAAAGKKKQPAPPPALVGEHQHPSGAFRFRTPEGWSVGPLSGRPEAIEAWEGSIRIRFVYQPGEAGLDSLHVNCMLERLSGPMDMQPGVKYEYDFLGGPVGQARALDSAFTVNYDAPIQGSQSWRQRTLTVIGGGHSLCLNSFVPAAVWKRSPEARAATEAVLASVTLNGRP